MKRNKKPEILKLMRANAREQVPMSGLSGRVVPQKRGAILEQIRRRESRRGDWD